MIMSPPILRRMKSLGYSIFIHGEYNLNLFGIRSQYNMANRFDDLLGAAYIAGDQWHVEYWPATTDPGTYWLNNPGRVSGTAILVEGQYRGAYRIGQHRGQYTALKQAAPMKVYRDSNRDNVLDMSPETQSEGIFGINIHRASAHRETETVGRYSAGCTVFADPDDFAAFLSICKRQVEVNGWETFTYTLVPEPMM